MQLQMLPDMSWEIRLTKRSCQMRGKLHKKVHQSKQRSYRLSKYTVKQRRHNSFSLLKGENNVQAIRIIVN